MRKTKTPEEKRNISKGLRSYWNKKGKKHAAILAGVGATAVAGRYGIKKGAPVLKTHMIRKIREMDEKLGESLKSSVYDSVTGKEQPRSKFVDAILNSETVKGAKEGLNTGIQDRVTAEKTKIADNVKEYVTETIPSTPRRTAEAFNQGRNVKPANENDRAVNTGRNIAKILKRGQADIKKTRSMLGFSFEPSETKHPRLIEFAKRKQRKAKKPLSAAHKANISQGLEEYYASIPKKEETVMDKVEKGTKSIGRVARSAKTIAEAANLASAVYERFKKPEVQRGVGSSLLMGLGVLSGVSGSARDLGSAARSFTGAADVFYDLASGSKQKRQKFREDALDVKRQANKTNRQVHAVRARLERRKMEQKDTELGIRSYTAGKYGRLVDSSAATKPKIAQAALMNAAVRAKEAGLTRLDIDYWD